MAVVTVCYDDYVALVTIDNPPVNALSKAIVEEIGKTFEAIEKTPSRVVVLTGAGKKAFVAGADIAQFTALDDRGGEALARHGQSIFQKIADFPIPVICAVDGFALGGGCELAMACDIRVASKKATFGLPETTLGIFPGYGGTQRLPRLVGSGMAKKLIFSGEGVSGEEAYRIGLCEMLVEENQALQAALNLAEKIAGTAAPLAVQAVKQLINRGMSLPVEEAITLEKEMFGPLCMTGDKNEGVKAFFEKRKPDFTGK